MNEREGLPSELPRSGGTGGQLLRQMRLDQGLDLEVLAAMLKVTPSKLDALESGRYQELPDAAFTRALAMTVCRVLKADPSAVLAGLPLAQPISLSASEPNQVPFKAKHARLNLDVPAALPWQDFLTPRWMVPAGVLLAAAALYFLPEDLTSLWAGSGPEHAAVAATAASMPASAASVASAASGAAAPASQAAASAAASEALLPEGATAEGLAGVQVSTIEASASSPAAAGAAPAGSALVLNVTESSWVEIRDAQGARLLSRHVTPGETIGVDGTPPLVVKIGNVAGVSMAYKGQSVDLSSFTRGNVARLELK